MFQSKIARGALRSVVLASLLLSPLLGAGDASASASSPTKSYEVAMANAGAKKYVVIVMSGTNPAGSFRNVWRSNPTSGSLTESVVHPGGTGHVYITVVDHVVYEKIDTVQWAYAGIPAKYKSYENKWFLLRTSSASYKTFLHQEVIYGALLIPINGTTFTIQDTTTLHGAKVTGLEGALTGSNPPVPVTLLLSKGKDPVPLEVSVPKTAKNKDVWNATYAYRASASPIVKPSTTLLFP